MPTSKRKQSTRPIKYLIALAVLAAVVLGAFAGAYYESRQQRVCMCVTLVKKVPLT